MQSQMQAPSAGACKQGGVRAKGCARACGGRGKVSAAHEAWERAGMPAAVGSAVGSANARAGKGQGRGSARGNFKVSKKI